MKHSNRSMFVSILVLVGFLGGLAIFLTGFQNKKDIKDNSYPLNEVVTYNTQGKGHLYLGKGWSIPEKTGTWSDGKEATMHLNVHSSKKLEMYIKYSPIVAPKNTILNVEVSVNGVQQPRWIVTKSGPNPDKLVLGPMTKGEYTIVFKILNPVSPAEVVGNSDKRYLGIFLMSTQIKEAEK